MCNSSGSIIGYQKKVFQEQDPANIKAAELMGRLHDRLEEIGYTGHPLEVYLVRILFCLFADDTTIFNKQQFQDFLEQRTQPDGSDLAARLAELFQVLNTPREKRLKNPRRAIGGVPYVNGRLFEEPCRWRASTRRCARPCSTAVPSTGRGSLRPFSVRCSRV